MLKVKVDGNIEKALRQYKAKATKTKLIRELRSRQEFVSDSEKERKQMAKAIYIAKKFGAED